MQQSEYQQDRNWGDSHESQIKSILAPLMICLAEIVVAPKYKDNKHATDFIVKLKGSDIAVRLRRHSEFPLKDMTIRSWRKNNAKTELAKLREGYATHYFYGKTNKNDVISQWIFIDLNKVRAAKLLERERVPTINSDGETAFITITVEELEKTGCIIDKRTGNTSDEQTSLLSKIKATLTTIDQIKDIPEEEDKPIIYLDPDMQAAEDELVRRDIEAFAENWCRCLLCHHMFESNTSYGLCPQCWSKDRLREFDRWQSACTKANRSHLVVSLTFSEWLTILSECTGRCAYCRVEWFGSIHMDEEAKGLVKGNVVPICRSCQEHKKSGWLTATKRVRDYLDNDIPLFDPIEFQCNEDL